MVFQAPPPKLIIKRKEKPKESDSDGEDPKRNLMTSAITKSNQTGSYYLLNITYDPAIRQFLLTLKDTT